MSSNNGNKVLIKRSDVSSHVPDLTALDLGELGVNVYDGKIFVKTETPFLTSIKEFLNSDDFPYVYNESLSGVTPKDGGNTITEVFSNVLGGYNNDISGGGSTTINGENNDIESDFSIIGSGMDNKIKIGADFSFIAAGQNNLINHSNVFTLGSNLSSHANDFTYVNNISATGKLYGDGSELSGIVAGDVIATSYVRSNSSNWDSTYSTVQSNSSTNWNNSLANQYTHTNFLPLTGGNLTGAITTTSTISSSQTISASGARVITGLPSDSTPVYHITVLTQGDYDAIVSPDPNTLYFIKP